MQATWAGLQEAHAADARSKPLSLSLLAAGTSYKFRVVAVNVIGSSPPSAPSKAYTVEGGRTHERPVDGPYITYNEAINETTIILKWTVSDLASRGQRAQSRRKDPDAFGPSLPPSLHPNSTPR